MTEPEIYIPHASVSLLRAIRSGRVVRSGAPHRSKGKVAQGLVVLGLARFEGGKLVITDKGLEALENAR